MFFFREARILIFSLSLLAMEIINIKEIDAPKFLTFYIKLAFWPARSAGLKACKWPNLIF